jgi:arginase
MDVAVIGVPYMLGDGDHPAAEGPDRYLAGGAREVLAAAGTAVTVERVERAGSGPFHDPPAASLAVNRALAPVVARAVEAGRLPLVLAGSCDVALGVLGGFGHSRCGVVWIDAHADFNTPESSVSGFFPGMTAAVLTGNCYADLWAQAGDAAPIPEERIVMLGTRELSPEAEREWLEASAIRVVPWHEGEPRGDVEAALDSLAADVEEVYLHVDNDALDPAVGPGIVDEPVPGGLSVEQLEEILRAVTARFRIRAATLATYTPERDEDDRTLRAGLRVIELLAEGSG